MAELRLRTLQATTSIHLCHWGQRHCHFRNVSDPLSLLIAQSEFDPRETVKLSVVQRQLTVMC